MPLRSDWSDRPCPIARSLDHLGDPWLLLIVREILTGNHRFDGLKSALKISDTVLTRRLADAVDAGLIDRVPYGGSGNRFEYSLTRAGEDILPVLHALAAWGNKHLAPPQPGQVLTVECTRCGTVSTLADWCAVCRQRLTVDSTAWRKASAPAVLVPLAPLRG